MASELCRSPTGNDGIGSTYIKKPLAITGAKLHNSFVFECKERARRVHLDFPLPSWIRALQLPLWCRAWLLPPLNLVKCCGQEKSGLRLHARAKLKASLRHLRRRMRKVTAQGEYFVLSHFSLPRTKPAAFSSSFSVFCVFR